MGKKKETRVSPECITCLPLYRQVSARIDQCTQSPLYVSMCGRHVTLGGKERKNAQSKSHVTGGLLLWIWMFGGTFQMTYYTILRYVALRCTSINSYTVDLMAGQPRYYVPSIYRIIYSTIYYSWKYIMCASSADLGTRIYIS